MKSKVMFLSLLFVSSFAFGLGPNGGGGGFVVKVGNSYRLLDLVEFGADENPYNPEVTMNPKILSRLKNSLYGFNEDVIRSAANKISHIHRQNPNMAYFLVSAMKEYTWKVVNAPLIRLDDIGESNVDISKMEVYQGAIRRTNDITFNREVISKMEATQVGALILHEIIYSMLTPEVIYDYGDDDTGAKETLVMKKQVNFDARKMVGAIYSELVETNGGGYVQAMQIVNYDRSKKWIFSFQDYIYRSKEIAFKTNRGLWFLDFVKRSSDGSSTAIPFNGWARVRGQDLMKNALNACHEIMAPNKNNSKEKSMLRLVEVKPQKTHWPRVFSFSKDGFYENYYREYELGAVILDERVIASNDIKDFLRKNNLKRDLNINSLDECVDFAKSLQPVRDPFEIESY